MKTFALQKRLASKVLDVGKNSVWFDSERLNDIKEAITKEDIKILVKEGAIKKKHAKGIKRRAGKIRQIRKRKGRARGEGKKKGKLKKGKKEYVLKIRNLRSYIKILKKRKEITATESDRLRKLAKAGIIKTKNEIQAAIKK